MYTPKTKTSTPGIKQLIAHEGSESQAYQDVAGYWTIGVGHLLSRSELTSGKININGRKLKWRDGLSDVHIQTLLKQDLADIEHSIHSALKPHILASLKQQHFDVLVSFVFNVGASAFKHSTLLKYLNQDRHKDIPTQLRRWVYAGGIKRKGLINRRDQEAQHWQAALT